MILNDQQVEEFIDQANYVTYCSNKLISYIVFVNYCAKCSKMKMKLKDSK